MDTKDINSLKPDENNPRFHPVDNIGMIEDSLEQFGPMRSIVIDEDDNIIAGNGTIEAAKHNGIKKILVIDAPDDAIVAVRKKGLTEDQKKKYKVYDNATTDSSEWDLEVLAMEYDEAFLVSLNISLTPDEEKDMSGFFPDIMGLKVYGERDKFTGTFIDELKKLAGRYNLKIKEEAK